VIHQGAGHVNVDTWTTLDLWLMLLEDSSTAAPAAEDAWLSDLTPAANELDHPDYTRVALTGRTATWNATTKLWELKASTVAFAAMDAASLDQGVAGWGLYIRDPDDDDAASPLVRTDLYDEPDPLAGGPYSVGWAASGVLTFGRLVP